MRKKLDLPGIKVDKILSPPDSFSGEVRPRPLDKRQPLETGLRPSFVEDGFFSFVFYRGKALSVKKGLVHIYTGEGKGKTTAAIGLAVRAAGHGLKVLFVQFFKEDSAPSGEKLFIEKAGDPGMEILRSNCKHPFFTGSSTDEEEVRGAINSTFELVKKRVAEGKGIDLLVLDEIMAVVNGGWIGLDSLSDFLDNRPVGLEVVLTGRNAPPELVRTADYVTEMLKIKHPFDRGVPARRGIDF
ncbi:MAG: cob(I)yrinic acid a,c-diamide adenosyltransferase [Thermodesulfobacteriota bacterium]